MPVDMREFTRCRALAVGVAAMISNPQANSRSTSGDAGPRPSAPPNGYLRFVDRLGCTRCMVTSQATAGTDG
jgi:hypothetical protein